MPSCDFQKICRDMLNLLTEEVTISCVGQKIVFSCKGDFADQITTIGETNSNLSFIQNDDPDQVFNGKYSIKHLVQFTKCTNLCPSIELYMKNDYPFIVKYTVASLGEIRMCLAPISVDEE
jgi:proliferating cell nuclear antigen